MGVRIRRRWGLGLDGDWLRFRRRWGYGWMAMGLRLEDVGLGLEDDGG